MNVYPQEYLEKWAIKEYVVKADEVKQLKAQLKTEGYTVASRTVSFIDLARCKMVTVIGLKDKTGSKTLEEVKKELKTLF